MQYTVHIQTTIFTVKSNSKDIIMLQFQFQIYAVSSFKLTIQQSVLEKIKIIVFTKILSRTQLFSILVMIINVSWIPKSILKWFLRDHVTLKTGVMMLKTQLCHHRNELYFKMFKNNWKTYFSKINSQYCRFYCIFDQINAALVCIGDSFFFSFLHVKIRIWYIIYTSIFVTTQR